MSSANRKWSIRSLAGNIIIYTAITEMILRHFFGVDNVYVYILRIEHKLGIPILLTIRLILLCLLLFVALNYLHKKFLINKQNISKFKKARHLILSDIRESPDWYPLAKNQKYNLTETELDEEIRYLLKRKLIKQKGSRKILKGYPPSGLFGLTDKGHKFLNR